MMKLLKKLLVITSLLLLRLSFTIQYDIVHTNTIISFKNTNNIFYTNTNAVFSNITVTEREPAYFILQTNGSRLYSSSNFSLNIRAVDADGYHVTITNVTNLILTALDTNFTPAISNLFVTNVPFISPTIATPDFTGMTITNQSYPIFGNIYIKAEPYTNYYLGLLYIEHSAVQGIISLNKSNFFGYGDTASITLIDTDRNLSFATNDYVMARIYSSADTNGKMIRLTETDPGSSVFRANFGFENNITTTTDKIYTTNNSIVTIEYVDINPSGYTNTISGIYKSVQNILLTEPLFIIAGDSRYLPIYGIDDNNQTNNISEYYNYSTANGLMKVIQSNQVQATSPGLGIITANANSPAIPSTNFRFLIGITPQMSASFSDGDFKLDIANNSIPYSLYIDVRDPRAAADYYPVQDYNSDISSASNFLQSNQVIINNYLKQISAVREDFTYFEAEFSKEVDITFNYTEADLINDGSIMAENDLKILHLNIDGSIYSWQQIDTTIVDIRNKKVTAKVTKPGVYALSSRATKIVEDLERVGIYPSIIDFEKMDKIYIINLPYNTEHIRIYSADAQLVKELIPGEGIGDIEVNGTAFYGGQWNGINMKGKSANAGYYFMKIKTGDQEIIKKFIIKRGK